MTAQELIEYTGIDVSLAEKVSSLIESDQVSSLEESEGVIEETFIKVCGDGCCVEPAFRIIGPKGYVDIAKY